MVGFIMSNGKWFFIGILVLGVFIAAQWLTSPVMAEDCKFTYENFGKKFMDDYCIKCHTDQKKSKLKRNFAPVGKDFNRPEIIKPQVKRILFETVENTYMPPSLGKKPSSEERQNLKQWLKCEYK